MKRVLILGINGFIGHPLSQRILADTDWEVHGMDLSSSRLEPLLPNPRLHFLLTTHVVTRLSCSRKASDDTMGTP